MTMIFHKLKISEIKNPVDDAVTLSIEVPKPLREEFHFTPGQHLIFRFILDGKEVRRSYSLNSSPLTDENLELTVKRVKGGLVSNYINDHLRIGDQVEVMAPQGRFYAQIDRKAYKTYFLFAAGSGITPIISILKSVLKGSPNSTVNLFYGNTNQDTILLRDELEGLKSEHTNRINIIQILSNPKVWSVAKSWKGRKGRIDEESVEWFITNYPPVAQNTEYYICGPGAMNLSVKKCLEELGVPKEIIHIEQFGNALSKDSKKINGFDNSRLTAFIENKKHQTTVLQNQTILESLKSVGAQPPYSCESGVCGTCVARIQSGEVEMKSCMALSQKDIDNGHVLTCQSIPITREVQISFGV